jgi:hypothetical protein
MNSLFKGIFNHFSATTTAGFYNDVSGRMYHNVAPQQATFPYCVYFSVSDVDDLDFSDEHENFLIQFNIFSKNNSALEAGNLLESLKIMFDNCILTVTGWRHLQFKRDMVNPNNDYSQVPPVQGYSVGYNVLLEKARS